MCLQYYKSICIILQEYNQKDFYTRHYKSMYISTMLKDIRYNIFAIFIIMNAHVLAKLQDYSQRKDICIL